MYLLHNLEKSLYIHTYMGLSCGKKRKKRRSRKDVGKGRLCGCGEGKKGADRESVKCGEGKREGVMNCRYGKGMVYVF